MDFQIRQRKLNLVIFEDYELVLVINWESEEPNFQIVAYSGKAIEALKEWHRFPLRRFFTKNTVDFIKESEMWDNFLKNLGRKGLVNSVIEAGLIMAKLKEKERQIEKELRQGTELDYKKLYS